MKNFTANDINLQTDERARNTADMSSGIQTRYMKGSSMRRAPGWPRLPILVWMAYIGSVHFDLLLLHVASKLYDILQYIKKRASRIAQLNRTNVSFNFSVLDNQHCLQNFRFTWNKVGRVAKITGLLTHETHTKRNRYAVCVILSTFVVVVFAGL